MVYIIMGLLVLVRHGFSEGNKNNVFSGFYEDHPLTPEGITGAEECGEILKTIKFNKVFSSKLSRASATCQLILNKNIFEKPPILELEDINERKYGVVGNLKRKEMNEYFSNDVINSWSNSINSAPPGGETIFQVYKRTEKFYKKYLENNLNSDTNILVVAHMHIVRSLICLIENIDINEILYIKVKNTDPIFYEIT